MTATDYIANKVLDHLCGGATHDVPTTYYVGLCTGMTEAGVITGEPTIGASGYARVAIDNDKTTWTTAASGILTNDILITFPTATGNWGTDIDTIFLADAASGDNVILYGTTTSRTIINGDVISFATGSITVSM